MKNKREVLVNLGNASDALAKAAQLMHDEGYVNEAADLWVKAEQVDNRAGIIRVTIPGE